MPRSKRKTASSRLAAPDFAKKKRKLGPKQRAANVTDTTVHARQLHVPSQTRDHTGKPGLLLGELLSRCGHHNAQMRVIALQGLCRALTYEHTAAHEAANLRVTGVLMRALECVADEHPGVRKAGSDVVVCTVEGLGEGLRGVVGKGVGAQLMAALSHVRMDVRVAGARCVKRVMGVRGVRVEFVFGEGVGNPLLALGEMLVGVEKRGGKAIVLEAIAAVCASGDNGGDDESGARKIGGRKGRFYYHGERKESGGDRRGGATELVRRMGREKGIGLMVKCGYIACECLPVGEARRDKDRGALLVAAVEAMRGLGNELTLQEEGVGIVRRVVGEWGGRGIERAEVGMAGLGVKCGLGLEVLKGVIGCEGADAIVQEFLEGGGEWRVGLSWMRRFLERGERGDWKYVAGVVGVLRVVLDVMEKGERERVLESVGRIGWGCLRGGGGKGVLEVVVEWLKKGVGEENRRKVGEVFVEGVRAGEIEEADAEEVVGAGVLYAGVGLEQDVVEGMIAQRTRKGRGGIEAGVRAALEERAEAGEGVRLRAVAAMAALEVAQRVPPNGFG